MTTPRPQDVVRAVFEALNAHDPMKVRGFYSEDCEIETPVGDMRGADAVVSLASAYWGAFSDLHWTPTNQCVAGDIVITEEFAEGTNDGALSTPQGEIPASGKRVRTRICEVSRVQDGRIVSLHLYWDNLKLMQDIGATPGG